MLWQDFLAPEKIKPYFEKVLTTAKLHHAYLFSGPAQVGKRTFAKLIAQRLNCLDPQTDNRRECRQCRKIFHDNHPDVRFLAPDGAFIKISQIRNVISDANLKPLEGRRKVYVITRADQLKTEAANALLKVLEEPNPSVIFILTTARPFALLPTIISRCLTINFNRLSPQAIQDYLVKRKGISESTALEIALLADGRVGKALELSNSEKRSQRAELIELFTMLLATASLLGYYGLIEKLLAGNKEEVQEKLHLFCGWIRDIILLQKSSEAFISNLDQVEKLNSLKQLYPQEVLMDLIYRLNDFCQLIPVNLNQKLYLENTLRRLWDNRRKI